MTKKDVNGSVMPEGDFQTKEITLEENWIRWNQESETYLCQTEDKQGQYFRGRGQTVVYVKNIIAPPQDEPDGFAITEEMRKTQ
eukprot:13644843-Heterocapsa_arctica.AAC.1